MAGRQRQRTVLLVGNLPEQLPSLAQETELRRALSRFGPCDECTVLREEDGASRGFALVKMARAAEAKRALDNTLLLGLEPPIKVRWALDTSTLCLRDLGPDVTLEMLREAMQQFGSVVSCQLDMAPPELGGGSRCRGYVEFPRHATAAKVQQLLSHNLFLIGNSPRPVRVEFAVDDAFDDDEGQPATGRGVATPSPHFAEPGSLEFDFALKWRELQLAHEAERHRLAELHRQEREVLRQEQYAIYVEEKRKFDAMNMS
ncbi:hypothetical protein AB1Y20_023019 [Prymnesium parvum]|uniref:RRM domain-containing protein n=1 Tax=Prymnesium parvum TaxID=97485 RepID=A0AB34JFJ7_PRYPA